MCRVLACLLLAGFLIGCTSAPRSSPQEARIQLCPTCSLYPVAVDKPSLARLEAVKDRPDAQGSPAALEALSREGKLFEVFNSDRVVVLGIEAKHTFIEQRTGPHTGRRGWVPSNIVR